MLIAHGELIVHQKDTYVLATAKYATIADMSFPRNFVFQEMG